MYTLEGAIFYKNFTTSIGSQYVWPIVSDASLRLFLMELQSPNIEEFQARAMERILGVKNLEQEENGCVRKLIQKNDQYK